MHLPNPGNPRPIPQRLLQTICARPFHPAPALRTTFSAINDNYLNVQQDILETFVDRGQVLKWPRAAGPFLAAVKLEGRLLVVLYQAAKGSVCG